MVQTALKAATNLAGATSAKDGVPEGVVECLEHLPRVAGSTVLMGNKGVRGGVVSLLHNVGVCGHVVGGEDGELVGL